MKDKEELEIQLSQTLEEGEMKQEEPSRMAQNNLIPKYEIRIPAHNDPIIEETRIIRNMVKEVDDRYDDYLSGQRPKKSSQNKNE